LPLRLATYLRRLASARLFAHSLPLLCWSLLANGQRAQREHHGHPRLHAMRHMLKNIGLPGMGFISDEDAPEDGQKYELKLARQGGEIIDVIYRVGDTYIPDALDQLSHFLRDSHNDEVKSYDPALSTCSTRCLRS